MAGKLLKIIRRVAHEKGFIYVSLGTLLYTGLAAAFWFILARILSVEEYGLINYYLAIASVGASVSTLGLKTTIVTFYPKEENMNLIRQAYLASFIAGFAAFLFLTVLGQPIAAILALVEVAFGMFVGEILGKRKYREYALLSFSTRTFQIILSLALYSILGLMGIFAGYILAIAVFGARYFYTLSKSSFSLQQLKGKLGFITYSYAHDLTGILAGYFDKVLIGLILGLGILGYYHLAFQVYWILAILPATLLNYLLPERSGGAISREVEILGFALAIFISALAILLAPAVVSIIFPSFIDSIILIQVMVLAIIPATVISIRKARLFSEEKPLSILTANIAALVIEILGLIVLPIWLGNAGLATAIVISQIALMVLLEISSRKASTKKHKE